MQKSIGKVVAGIYVLCLGLQVLGVWGPPVASARSLAEIKKSKELRICLAGSKQDFYLKNALALVEFLGEGIEANLFHFDNWNDQFVNQDGVVVRDAEYTPEPLASGRCDLYPNDLVRLQWREKKMAFIPLYISKNTIIVNRDNRQKFHKLDDISGKKAAIMQGTSFHTWLEQQNEGIFKNSPVTIIFMHQEEAIKAAESGAVDFAISGADGALWAAKKFAPQVAVAFSVGEITEYGWCVAKKDTDLQQEVLRFFDRERSSPGSQLNAIWKETIGMTLGEYVLYVSSIPMSVAD